jgi:uncharacterized protein YuzE
MKHHQELILVKSSSPPVVEIDTEARAAYVRFRPEGTAVAKTVSVDQEGPVVAIDLDAKNDVIGVELIGVQEFSVKSLLHYAPVTMQKPELLQNARYVLADKEAVGP